MASFEAPAGSGWSEGSTGFSYAGPGLLPGSLTKLKLKAAAGLLAEADLTEINQLLVKP